MNFCNSVYILSSDVLKNPNRPANDDHEALLSTVGGTTILFQRNMGRTMPEGHGFGFLPT